MQILELAPNSFPNGRLGVISDVHANLHALEAVLLRLRAAQVAGIVNAGDNVGYSARPNECLRRLRAEGVWNVQGNYDVAAATNQADCGCGAATGALAQLRQASLQWTQTHLTEESRADMLAWPAVLLGDLAGVRFAVMHGGWDRLNEVIRSQDTAALDRLAEQTGAQLVILGHTHLPFMVRRNRTLFLNPGSVGKPLAQAAAAYAIVEAEPAGLSVRFGQAGYAVEENIRDLIAGGLPATLGPLLREGREAPEPDAGGGCPLAAAPR